MANGVIVNGNKQWSRIRADIVSGTTYAIPSGYTEYLLMMKYNGIVIVTSTVPSDFIDSHISVRTNISSGIIEGYYDHITHNWTCSSGVYIDIFVR